MKDYNPLNWYWFVGGDKTKAYSSASGNYVQANDPTFVAWQEDGTLPTNILSEAELGAVLAGYYPSIPRPAAGSILDGYQQEQADDIFRHKLVKFLFALNNRVRVLEGQSALTIPRARAYFKGLM